MENGRLQQNPLRDKHFEESDFVYDTNVTNNCNGNCKRKNLQQILKKGAYPTKSSNYLSYIS